MLGLSGTALGFLITKTSWLYHVFPALGFACLLTTLLFSQWLSDNLNLRYLLAKYLVFYYCWFNDLLYPFLYCVC